jgi:phosphonoacetaldehyde hydrolase
VGLSLADWQTLPAAQQKVKRERAYARHQQSGAHYTVDSIADVLPCIDDIQARIRRGEVP